MKLSRWIAASTMLGLLLSVTACGMGITEPFLDGESVSASMSRAPDTITLTTGEGQPTFNNGGRTDGKPPPEVAVTKPDGTIVTPRR